MWAGDDEDDRDDEMPGEGDEGYDERELPLPARDDRRGCDQCGTPMCVLCDSARGGFGLGPCPTDHDTLPGDEEECNP